MLADTIGAIITQANVGRTPALALLIGEKHKAENGVPPRIVWVPVSESFGPAKKIGGNPRAVRTRLATVECEVWGADLATTEQMINDIIFAAHTALGHGWYEVQSGRWKTEGELRALGYECALTWTFEIPVVGTAATATTPETYTTTTTIDSVVP